MTDLPVDQILGIAHRHGAMAVSVFGSRARGDARKDSDLDLLVELNDKATLLSILSMERELEEAIGVRVEVVTVGDLHPAVRSRVLEEAQTLVA